MILKQLQEVIWRYYQEGRAKATSQELKLADIGQMVRMGLSNQMRSLYYENLKLNDGNEYFFKSPLLSTIVFPLSDADITGMRRADMSSFDVYRLPKNSHITNAVPLGTGCNGNDGSMQMTQVQPGEENFYLSPEFKFFKFYVVKGRGINTYNLPPCITNVGVESTFDSDLLDISLDIAFDIANQVLGVSLKLKQFPVKILDNSYNPNASELRRRLEETQNQP